MSVRMKISKGGQVSIPARIRRRWNTSTVVMDDRGDRIVLKPAPDDPIAAAEGALADELAGLDPARIRSVSRDDEATAIERRERP
ncbi:MAG: AbrB/MazE/SpoVT family DNA-binding domain-containing protein [Trueperaceae bacterium]|nr:AbrB/MazE/SpoVT family DNA-binding domain-containing protein [Trueperaceae bacterium]